jgi:hypothetical protein
MGKFDHGGEQSSYYMKPLGAASIDCFRLGLQVKTDGLDRLWSSDLGI